MPCIRGLSGQRIDLPDSSVLSGTVGDITVEAYLRIPVTEGGGIYQTIIWFQNLYVAKLVSGGDNLYWQDPAGNSRGPFIRSATDWHRYSFVRTAGSVQIYVDGAPLSVPMALSATTALGTVRQLVGTANASEFLDAFVADIRVWSGARTQAALAADYGNRLTGAEPGLAGYWRLDEGAGTTAAGTGATGTLSSATLWNAEDPGLAAASAPDTGTASRRATIGVSMGFGIGL